MLFSTDLTHSTLGEQKVLHFCLLDLWQTGWSRDRLIFELNNFGTILERAGKAYSGYSVKTVEVVFTRCVTQM